MFAALTAMVLGVTNEAQAFVTSVSTLLTLLIVVGLVAIVLAIIRIFNIVQLSRFGTFLILVLATIPVTLAVISNRISLTGTAEPEPISASVAGITRIGNQARFEIKTSKPAIVSVRWGTSEANLSRIAIEQEPSISKEDHIVVITIVAGSRYFYQILINGEAVGSVSPLDAN